jgi:hypothetical protein
MPTRSPGESPGPTIHDLGLPGRAVTALSRAGVTSVDALALLTSRDLAAINGLGPGMVAAIRLVVPEPPARATGPRSASDRRERTSTAIDPEVEPVEEESPGAPTIPSFDSLRPPRRHTAFDVLLSSPPPAPTASAPGQAQAPRPPEYADLLRLGGRLVSAVSGFALESVRAPIRVLRRLLGV